MLGDALETLADTESTATLLENAVIAGDLKALGTLVLQQKANINTQHLATSLLATAIMNKQSLMVKWILRLKTTYLITEVDIEEIKELISEFIKQGKQDKSIFTTLLAFKEEIQPGHFQKIENKISDIKTITDEITAPIAPPTVRPILHALPMQNDSIMQMSALFQTIENQDFDNFNRLLNSFIQQNFGFNINQLDKNGKILLHHAVINPDVRFLNALLECAKNPKYCADPNIGDPSGWTPAHWVAFTGNHFDTFMKNTTLQPINWDAKTKKGKTILQIAELGLRNQRAESGKKISTISEENIAFLRSKVVRPTVF